MDGLAESLREPPPAGDVNEIKRREDLVG